MHEDFTEGDTENGQVLIDGGEGGRRKVSPAVPFFCYLPVWSCAGN